MLMAAPFEISAAGDAKTCSRAIEAAFQEAARIEKLFTIYQPQAPLACFNRLSKKGVTFLDREILQVLSKAIVYAEKSAGAFDPVAGRLVDLWGFGPGDATETPPSDAAIAHARSRSGYSFLKIDIAAGRLECLRDGLQINLGGIAKGYAIDRAVSVLKDHGIARALVSCGSTLYGFGRPQHWRIAIQHPRREAEVLQEIDLSDCALATSGDYERCFVHNGLRYSHLIDPRTGFPVAGMVASVSVIAKTAMAADALSTTAFILGTEHGRRLLEAESAVSGFLVLEDKNRVLSFKPTQGWPGFSTAQALGRRRFLKVASLIFMGVLLPGGLLWPRKLQATMIRFATEKEALARMMPEADRFSLDPVHLNDEQLQKAQNLAGKGFRQKTYNFWVGYKGDNAIAYALKLDVVGKKRPITFLIGMTPTGIVKAVEVLVYRESKGSEIRYARFMKQFYQKTRKDPVRLGRDIRSISGATLSSRAAAYAVRKTLSIFEVVYGKKLS